MSTTYRQTTIFQCGQCPESVVFHSDSACPMSEHEWPTAPKGWFTITRRRDCYEDVDLCSAACLQAWAGKQGGGDD